MLDPLVVAVQPDPVVPRVVARNSLHQPIVGELQCEKSCIQARTSTGKVNDYHVQKKPFIFQCRQFTIVVAIWHQRATEAAIATFWTIGLVLNIAVTEAENCICGFEWCDIGNCMK